MYVLCDLTVLLAITDSFTLDTFRDEGPTKGNMFGPVAEAILFRESNGRGAVLIEGGG
jgi:hypothetical protein